MQSTILFRVINKNTSTPSNATGWSAYLIRNEWDDWDKYCTRFYLIVVDETGEHHEIGYVKIGQRGLKPHSKSANIPEGYRKPNIPQTFDILCDDFFSLGQDESYYDNLNTLKDSIHDLILRTLRDVAFDDNLWNLYRKEEVMHESLLRSVTESTAMGQLQRLAHGGARLTSFRFTYSLPNKQEDEEEAPFELDFKVNPHSPIPTNVHVLIGRNGVGKTWLLSSMIKALIEKNTPAQQSGKFELDKDGKRGSFANVVNVSFSAFDATDLPQEQKNGWDTIGYIYIGLRSFSGTTPIASPKSTSDLAKEFVDSLKFCKEIRPARWQRVIATLQSDPIFHAEQLASMIENDDEEALKRFMDLSSGHKIILLTLTRLVEKVEEKTLVLIDEPEAHLHPPLLSAMIRAISELMVDRNGVAIVATHSPVILQEVPRQCVWILKRNGSVSTAIRPTIETFAENVGVLTKEVFQLELTKSGYHQVLSDICKDETNYEETLALLGNSLGFEGRAVLKAMILSKQE